MNLGTHCTLEIPVATNNQEAINQNRKIDIKFSKEIKNNYSEWNGRWAVMNIENIKESKIEIRQYIQIKPKPG